MNAPAGGDGGAFLKRVLVASRGELARRVIRLLGARGLETVAVFAASEAEEPWLEEATYDAYLGDGEAAAVWSDPSRFVPAAMDAGCEAIHVGDERVGDDFDLYAAAAESNVGVLGTEPRRIGEILDRARLSSRARQAHLQVVPRSDVLGPDADGLEAAARIGLPLWVGTVDAPSRERIDAYDALGPALARARSRGKPWLEAVVHGATSLGVVFVADAHGTVRHLGTTRLDPGRNEAGGVALIEPPPAALAGTERLLRETGFVGLARARWWAMSDGSAWFDAITPRLSASIGPIEAATGQDLVALQIAVGLGERG